MLVSLRRSWLRKLTKTFRGYLKVSHRADGLVDRATSGRLCKGVASADTVTLLFSLHLP
jgi:hypothetical protein